MLRRFIHYQSLQNRGDIGAITAQGQRKKLLQDEKVVKILEKYNITIE